MLLNYYCYTQFEIIYFLYNEKNVILDIILLFVNLWSMYTFCQLNVIFSKPI